MVNKDIYLVDVIGFNPTERAMLSSIFALGARRNPGFAQYEPGGQRTASIFLVDADAAAAMAELQALRKHQTLPTVLVGASDHGTGLPLMARPLQWARLLQALEDALGLDEAATLAEDAAIAAELAHLTTISRSKASAARKAAQEPGSTGAERSEANRALGDTVLVVDDNASVRHFMKTKLAPFGFDVDYAETGEQAVGLTGNREYTCVFLDVVLPGIDGYQVCKMIKSNKQAIKKTAVVMLTSRSSPFDKLRGSLAGCDEYVTKPLEEDRLLEVIARFLPNSRK